MCANVRELQVLNIHTCVVLQCSFQMEFFQDDIFPDTKVTWEPSLTAEEWLRGKDTRQKTISLKPEGMTACERTILIVGTLS